MKTMVVNLKRIVMCCMMFVVVNAVFAQDFQAKHQVQRGETLASIAKHYGVTEQMIKEANPQMGNLFYVGLKLNIPTKNKENIHETSDSAKPILVQAEETKIVKVEDAIIDNNDDISTKEAWNFAMEIGYGFLDNGGIKGASCFAYQATVGVNYMINDALYAGARIGYNSAHSSFTDITSDIHMIVLPLEFGYVWGSENIKLIPFSGLDLNIGLNGKTKFKSGNHDDEKIKIGGKLGVALNLGLRLYLWGFNLSGKYHLPINDQQKGFFGEDAYPEMSIGFGF